MSFRHESNGRSLTAGLVIGAIWAGLLLAWWRIEASIWIVGGLGALTLPAFWDAVTARPAGLDMDQSTIRWWSGRHHGDVRLETIEHARFDTRLDMSVRVRLVLANPGKTKVAIPQDALPRWQDLQRELQARGVVVKRHHFSLL